MAAVAPLHAADIDELFYQEALAAVATGERERALAMLEALVLRQPQHAGAWLDLALLYCDLGDERKSREILARIEAEFEPSQVIQELIKLQWGRSCGAPTAGPHWSFGFQTGYDSNVNRGASNNRVVFDSIAGPVTAQLTDEMLAKRDGFNEAWAEGLWRQNSRSLRFSALTRQYHEISAFNAQAVSLAGEQTWTGSQADGAVSAKWTSARLGGSAFFNSLTALAGVTGRHALNGVRPAVDFALARNRFPAAPAFDSTVLSVRPGLAKIAPADAWHVNTSWRANLVATVDLADRRRPGGDRYGGGAELLGTWRLAPGIQLSGSGLVQEMHDQEAYFLPLLNTHRRQLLIQGRLELAVYVGRGIHWVTTWTGQKSHDNLSFLDYKTSVLQSGFMIKY